MGLLQVYNTIQFEKLYTTKGLNYFPASFYKLQIYLTRDNSQLYK